ncbi:MAG: trehalose-phosphatase [Pseudomonadota bacterium]
MPEPLATLPDHVDWCAHAVFLDFDGTLTPIVCRPEAVVVDERTHRALERLQDLTDNALAVISGRAVADLERHLVPTVCALSGSHGLEFKRGGQVDQAGLDAREVLQPALTEISNFAAKHSLRMEDKPGAVTLHFRDRPDLADACGALVDRIVAGDDALRSMHGNMISEVAPAGIDKGAALKRFMEDAPFKGRIPIMVGDDVTDEDAFKAANDLGGFGIKIGPGPTAATFHAADTEGFLAWLWQMAAMPES